MLIEKRKKLRSVKSNCYECDNARKMGSKGLQCVYYNMPATFPKMCKHFWKENYYKT